MKRFKLLLAVALLAGSVSFYIGGADRGRFEKPPEELYYGKAICVTGMIELYQGRQEIIEKDPSQIKVK